MRKLNELKNIYKSQEGAVLLVSVLVITSIVLLLSFTVNSDAIDNLQISMQQRRGVEVSSLAESCLGEVLIKLKGNKDWSAEQINLDEGQCQLVLEREIDVVNVQIIAQKEDYVSELNVRIDLSFNPIKIINWDRGLE